MWRLAHLINAGRRLLQQVALIILDELVARTARWREYPVVGVEDDVARRELLQIILGLEVVHAAVFVDHGAQRIAGGILRHILDRGLPL